MNYTKGNILHNSPHHLLCSFSNNRQSGHLTKQARRRTINQTHQKVQKHSAIQTHQQIQPNPISWIKPPRHQIRYNQQRVKYYSLHRVKPHEPAEIRVSDHNKIEGYKDEKPIKWDAVESPNRGD